MLFQVFIRNIHCKRGESVVAEGRAAVLSAVERVDRECREWSEGGDELARGDGAAEEVVGGAWGPAAVRPAERRGELTVQSNRLDIRVTPV